MDNLLFTKLTNYAHQEDIKRFEEIYIESFPPYDRKPFSRFIELKDEITIYITRKPDEIIAFAVLLPLQNSPTYYMSYLAVEHTHRGQGIGKRFFNAIIEDLKQTTESQALVWEVEPPEEDDQNSLRRIHFYEQEGAEFIKFVTSYLMPTMEKTTIPMNIMWRPIQDIQVPATPAQARSWIEGIYTTMYSNWIHILPQILKGIPEEN